MFNFRKNLIKNPGATLKSFADKMIKIAEGLTVGCGLIGIMLALYIMIYGGNLIDSILVVVIAAIWIIVQYIFIVTVYGMLYGVGTIIESNSEQVELLAYKSQENVPAWEESADEDGMGIVDNEDTYKIKATPKQSKYNQPKNQKKDKPEEVKKQSKVDVPKEIPKVVAAPEPKKQLEEDEPVYNHIEPITDYFYLANRSDKDVILNKEGKVIYSNQQIEYVGIKNIIAIKEGDKWSIKDSNGNRVIDELFDWIKYDGFEKILLGYTPIEEENPFYLVTERKEGDFALPPNTYILSVGEEGQLMRTSQDEIILRNMIYGFEYTTIPWEWKKLIDTSK